MWKRLPSWAWIGAWLLAFLAGMVNVIGLMDARRLALTHMTGLTSRLAQGIADGNSSEIAIVASIMFSFIAGAALSGLLIQDNALHWDRRYTLALSLEGLILTASALVIKSHPLPGLCAASLACGLQNAIASNFSGSTLRTTHVSGMFTDLGISIGHYLRNIPVNRIRVRICLSTISGFALGGIASVTLFQKIGPTTLYIPATIAFALALTYQFLPQSQKNMSGD
ncbi:MAG TPA: YoaK family protein [Tepidisphaeraceae bacterium]|jgi:uncharacterized membrane protein YoaK (UPF0700 family)|nr:YoaK family protein [Tepidisphaeraceae bacterium]